MDVHQTIGFLMQQIDEPLASKTEERVCEVCVIAAFDYGARKGLTEGEIYETIEQYFRQVRLSR